MFDWVKKLFTGSSSEPELQIVEEAVESADAAGFSNSDSLFDDDFASTTTLQFASAWDVADRYLRDNPAPTPCTMHALVDAGAANLLEASELLDACQKIADHGYQFPINGVLLNDLSESDLLQFVHWQARVGVAKESYANELKIRELIEMFRASQ